MLCKPVTCLLSPATKGFESCRHPLRCNFMAASHRLVHAMVGVLLIMLHSLSVCT